MALQNRQKISVSDIQYRNERPESKKIIFISCEGSVTEELYFKILSRNIFKTIQSKIQVISIREDFNSIEPQLRMQVDIDEQNKATPRQVMGRMDKYLNKNKDLFKPEQNLEDEYWIVIDIDDHTDEYHIKEWNNVLDECDAKKYQYAISNPFFELWLYLHHVDISDKAYSYAVREGHLYEKTTYYVDEIKAAGARMTGNGSKKPHCDDFTLEKVSKAIKQAKSLQREKEERWPDSLGTTVYLLVEKIMDMLESNE